MTELLFNAFIMNTASHIQHGLWRHPEARQADFNDVDLWVDLARTLEGGLFDAAFFADVSGMYGPVNGDYTVNVREGLQIPSNDPSVLLSAMAVHTKHLGLAFTSNVMQAHPFEFARRISTLDHISKGRVAWNIVTSTQENAARNFGLDRLTAHDARYEWAEEYLDVVFKLWEGSWDDGALVKDRERGVFADRARIHKINHVGKRYRVEGPHLPSPSPQRTPFLFQAGSSPVGRAFAAKYAEAQFISTPNAMMAGKLVAETRAGGAGRAAGGRYQVLPGHRVRGGRYRGRGAPAESGTGQLCQRGRVPGAREPGRFAGGRAAVAAGDEAAGHQHQWWAEPPGVAAPARAGTGADGGRSGAVALPQASAPGGNAGADRGRAGRMAARRGGRDQRGELDDPGVVQRIRGTRHA